MALLVSCYNLFAVATGFVMALLGGGCKIEDLLGEATALTCGDHLSSYVTCGLNVVYIQSLG